MRAYRIRKKEEKQRLRAEGHDVTPARRRNQASKRQKSQSSEVHNTNGDSQHQPERAEINNSEGEEQAVITDTTGELY